MSYTANQYNYCTPLSSVADITNADRLVVDKKYFTLHDNILDGSFFPVTDDVGLWGNSIADSDGVLPVPFVVTIEEEMRLDGLQVIGSIYSYPVDFTIQFYNGGALVATLSEIGNSKVSSVIKLEEVTALTKVVVSVTKISNPGGVAKLFNTLQALDLRIITGDTLSVAHANRTSITNRISKTQDKLRLKHKENNTLTVRVPTIDSLPIHTLHNSELINIHTVMKELTRQVFGKVYVTYTDPMLSDTIPEVSSSGAAHNSRNDQLLDGGISSEYLFFTLYDNDLTGRYHPMSEYTQTGWVSNVLSDAEGYFDEHPYVLLTFASRPISELYIYFDNSHGNIVEDFTVELTDVSGRKEQYSFVGNTETEVLVVDTPLIDIVSIKVTISKIQRPYSPAVILDIPVVSTFLYTGYQDNSQLISIDMLEELTYEDDVEALGGVSANEVRVVFDNTTRYFNMDNPNSPVARHLRRNRKIAPWLGAEVTPGTIEWYSLGTYWTYNWLVPYNSLVATAIAFDTLGLLDTTSFINHQTLKEYSLGALVDYVLTDAKAQLNFIEWTVAEELYDVVIPYAWFANGSHTAALRRISKAYPMHIYCSRDGKINAAPQRLKLDHYNDIWSDSTNVIEKEYNSLYTVVPNLLNIKVTNTSLLYSSELVKDEASFNVSDVNKKVLNFSNPYVSDIVVSIDSDISVAYDYEVYSWGISINFTGSGTVRSIICLGTALDTTDSATLTVRNEDSIHSNGEVTRDISAEFIQTSSLASYIADRIFSLSESDKYDAEVKYRGDIALSINDPILLLDGIAPDNRYNIKRHQLLWDGGLSGTANLNT